VASIFDAMFARVVGVRIYGLGAVVLGLTGLVWGDFAVIWQPDAPTKSDWGYVVAVLPLLAGVAMQWHRSTLLAALALLVFEVTAVVFLDLPRGFAQPSVFVAWYGAVENLALAAGALIIFTWYVGFDSATVERLGRISRVMFGLCLIYFGLAHHFYLANTVSMVPGWLPPGRTFWAYATAAGHIAAGIAIMTGVCARLAAILLTAMFIVFSLLVHGPKVLTDPHTHFGWVENAVNIALIGSAWVIAASISKAKRA
jgi:uncharacterized membrane protein YphA (DoxX/SURF4 family)